MSLPTLSEHEIVATLIALELKQEMILEAIMMGTNQMMNMMIHYIMK